MTDPAERPAEDPEDPEDWQRLHPLSPLLRGGFVLLAVLGYALSRVFETVASSLPGGGDGEDGLSDGGLQAAVSHPLLAAGAVLLVVLAVGGAGYVSWRFSRFRVTPSQVELRSGVLFRQHRQVSMDRIQAVETARPLLARLAGLSQVVVQSAGGSDSHLTLAFLGESRAEEVRARLLELAGASDEDRDTDTPAWPVTGVSPEEPGRDDTLLVTVPNGRLVVATILHGSTAFLAVLVAFGAPLLTVFAPGVGILAGTPALIPVLIGVVGPRIKELLVHGNFSLARSRTALRVRHGLTDLRVASLPLHRVQAVEVLQPLWWRPFGWWRVRVNVAGVHAGENSGTETVLLPVGTLEEAHVVLATLGVGVDDPLVLDALEGSGAGGGWVGPPRSARFVAPWTWRRVGYQLVGTAVAIRLGRWTRRAIVIPYARVQSLTVDQGPVEARLGLANARVVSTPGPVTPHVPHLARSDAEQFLAVVGERARTARRATSPPSPLASDRPPLVD